MRKAAAIGIGSGVLVVWAALAHYFVDNLWVHREGLRASLTWQKLELLATYAEYLPWVIWGTAVVAVAAIATALAGTSGRNFRFGVAVSIIVVGVVCTKLQLLGSQQEQFRRLVSGAESAIAVNAARNEIVWQGRLSYYAPNYILGYASQAPHRPWMLVLRNVPGGSIEAADVIQGLAQESGIRSVRVEGECASMCAVLWASLQNRELVEGSVLGWHGLYDAATGKPMTSSINDKLIPALVKAGLPEDLVRYWAHLPLGRMYYTTASDMAKWSLSFKLVPAP